MLHKLNSILYRHENSVQNCMSQFTIVVQTNIKVGNSCHLLFHATGVSKKKKKPIYVNIDSLRIPITL